MILNRELSRTDEPRRVLFVGANWRTDSEALADHESIAVTVAETAEAAVSVLDSERVHGVVSSDDLGGTDAIAFLSRVRERDEHVPFVFCPRDGSELLASDAIAAGVTDYVPRSAVEDGTVDFWARIEAALADAAATGPSNRLRLDALVEAIPDVAFLLDEEGRYVDVFAGSNHDLLYADSDDLVGKRLHDLYSAEKADRYLAHMRRAIETGDVQRMEYQLDVHSGTRWFEARTAPLSARFGGRHLVVLVTRDITDRKENERTIRQQEQRLRTIIESSTDAIMIKDCDGVYRLVNQTVADVVGRSKDDIVGRTDADLFGPEVADRIRVSERRALETERVQTSEERLPVGGRERIYETTRVPYYGPDDELWGTIGVCRDITDRKHREQELKRRRDELETLNQINAVLNEVVAGLVGAATREEIAQTVCDRLAESAFYESAWLGEPNQSRPGVSNLTTAGVGETHRRLLDEVRLGDGSDAAIADAYRDGDVQVVQSVAADAALPGRLSAALADDGIESGIVVPVAYGGSVYGVLVVWSNRTGAFSEHEQVAFEVLGETIGLAINAVGNRLLVHADAVVELEFLMRDAESFIITASEELDCRFTLDDVVAAKTGDLVYYETVAGASPSAVVAVAERTPSIERVRHLGDHGEESHFEFVISGASASMTLAEYGAKTVEAVADRGEGRIVAEIAADADVRTVVEGFKKEFPSSELVGKREVERAAKTAAELRERLENRLTERQKAALRASYFAGYYEWPRGSTAEEVAESLGISSPTLHQHLRKAQRKLLAVFLEGDASDDLTV